jgi:S1-C subfamily serine protease
MLGIILGAYGRDYAVSDTKTSILPIAANATPVGVANVSVVPTSNQTGGTLNPTGNLENDIRAVVKAVRPAVVFISVTMKNGNKQIWQDMGTGSIITQDGYILTNNHVVEGACEIRVTLPDGRSYTGQLIGSEKTTSDLAVIKIDPKAGETLPSIKIGDSSQLEVGQWVIAIGNALRLPGGPTVTTGVISNIGRSVQEPSGTNLTNLIQADAAINPGNSGGPLLNLRGELIGINTAVAFNPEEKVAAQSIGFAIPASQAQPYINTWINGDYPD